LKERGPIEAMTHIAHTIPNPSFPRLKERGPIEAAALFSMSIHALLFPRLKERGPIEAVLRLDSLYRRSLRFHA